MNDRMHETSDTERRNSEFLALLGKHELQVATFVHALVPSWHDAEDIIQEMRLQLWREFGKFHSGSDFLAWACTIARYVVHTHVKKSRRKPLLFSSDVGDIIVARMVKTPEQTDRRLEMLADCVRKLGTDALDLLRRCYIDREKIKDIAAELGRSLTGTYSALSRIRHELLDCMRERLHREESQ